MTTLAKVRRAGRPDGRSRWKPAAATMALIAVTAAGCGGSPDDRTPDPTPTPAPTPTASGYGTRYSLPDGLCDVADLTELLEVYPDEERDSVLRNNGDRLCDTTLRAGPRLVLSLSIEAILTEEDFMDDLPSLPEQWFEGQRRFASGTPTDVEGVGAGAFWFGDDYTVVLETYDGNLNLRVRVSAVGHWHTLAPDMADRIAAVAVGTMARLAG